MVLSSGGELVIQSLLKVYSDPKFLRVILEIPHDGKYVSLRLLDHFVTYYTKHNRVWINDIDIQDDYKSMLSGYNKDLFDPFCRNERIVLLVDEFNQDGTQMSFSKDRAKILKKQNVRLKYEIATKKDYPHGIVTTIAQLHFFSWCIKRNVIQYVLRYSSEIQESMTKRPKEPKKKKKMIFKQEKKFRIKFA